MGTAAAASAAQRLLQRGADMLVSCGCCAGLAADLHSGDVLLANRIDHVAGQTLPCHGDHMAIVHSHLAAHFGQLQPMLTHADNPAASRYVVGKLLTVSKPIFDSKLKQQLAAQHEALAADMETFAVAQTASAASIPFLALRVVLDDCRQALPAAVTASCDAFGTLPVRALLQACWQRPALVPELVALARSRSRAASSLRILARIFHNLTPG